MSDTEREWAVTNSAGTSPADMDLPSGKDASRRRFLKMAGAGGASLVFLALSDRVLAAIGQGRQVYAVNATGLIVHNPTRCTGCRRCETACTAFNEGKVQPSMARIKVGRNLSFGPAGTQTGFFQDEGLWGNHLIVADTCNQCPHPVPCQLACPTGAIEVVPPVYARVVNQETCIGCRMCQRACPWGMTSFDEELGKATKCHQCNGSPECVEACPAGALEYIPWEDKTREIPSRFAVPGYITMSSDVAATCAQCHSR